MMRMAAFFVSAALVASCGGDGSSCGKVQPCGGDVVGSWRYEAFCGEAANLAFPRLPCTRAKATSVRVSRTGTLTIRADGSFTEDGEATATFTLDVPVGCVPDGGTCQSLGNCSPTPTGCRCTQVDSTPVDSSGTAKVDGMTVTLSVPNHVPSEFSYCVQGDELHLDMIVTPLATGKPELQLGAVARRIAGP